MWGFHAYMRVMLGGGGGGVRDTQCGFKLFTRAAARRIFPAQHIERWAFDVELVHLAARLRVPVAEVPVAWHEVAGSKVELASASLQMARDVLVIRIAYALGWWSEYDGLGGGGFARSGGLLARVPAARRAVDAARKAEARVKAAAGRAVEVVGEAREAAQKLVHSAKDQARKGLAAVGLEVRDFSAEQHLRGGRMEEDEDGRHR
jgi:hypothetical protein